MSNSPLVDFTKISPNKSSPRNHKIDTITIHCVVGQLSVETIGNIFAPIKRQASCNYGLGPDGRIGMYCEEKDRSWCSGGKDRNGNPIRVNGISGSDNDQQAITIEVASDTTHPYAITDKAYSALIELVADICKRNSIPQLHWEGDKTLVGQVSKQNMTVHRWFANKACPGDYIYNRLGQIAQEVNAKINSENHLIDETSESIYHVQTGAFKKKQNAEIMLLKIKSLGFETYMLQNSDGLYKIQVGAYKNKSNAEAMAKKLKSAGFDTYITTKNGPIENSEKKSIDVLVGEVINGLWGNGNERKKRLTDAGYSYLEIQKKVNELL